MDVRRTPGGLFQHSHTDEGNCVPHPGIGAPKCGAATGAPVDLLPLPARRRQDGGLRLARRYHHIVHLDQCVDGECRPRLPLAP